MPDTFPGSFPGGPSRRGDASEPRRAPRLERMREREERIAARELRIRRGGRARRVVLGAVVSFALAGGAGYLIGVMSHTTPREIAEEREAGRRRDLDALISGEVNRTLLQLWKMEDLEAQRGSGRGR